MIEGVDVPLKTLYSPLHFGTPLRGPGTFSIEAITVNSGNVIRNHLPQSGQGALACAASSIAWSVDRLRTSSHESTDKTGIFRLDVPGYSVHPGEGTA
jgi:hypothetical protein